MAYFKNLITDKILKNQNAIQAQRLASCMAWQILNDYPTRQKPSEWKIYNNLRGVMLADEVGGGKTFETLAIISKAILEQTSKSHSKDRFRVLIIANPSIRSKWEWSIDETCDFEEFISKNYSAKCDIAKFIQQTEIDKPSTQKLFYFFSNQRTVSKKKNWTELDKLRQAIWLTSFPSIPRTNGSGIDSKFIQDRRRKDVFPKNFFDWIIVDEAHSLKGSFNDMEESMKWNGTAVSKIYAAINGNKTAKLLLLTATPFQNNKYELQQLLNMLEVTDKKNTSKNITSLISIGINTLEKELSSLNGENISIENLKELKRNIDNDINALIGNQVEEELQRPTMVNVFGRKAPCENGLDDYLRDIMIRNTKESLPIIPVVAKLDEREKFQYLLLRDLVKVEKKSLEDEKDKTQMFSTKLSQLVSSRNSFSKSNINEAQNSHIEKLFKGKNLIFEAKCKKLFEKVDEIERTNGKNVITIFVSWIPTVDTLTNLFRKKYGKNKVFKLTGQTPTDERDNELRKIIKANATEKEKMILIASRVGNEGLDFDKFSNRVIHYDNNFNPAIIDQRNGRVYRGSNIKASRKKVVPDDIKIYQLFIEGSYDQRILFIEQEKRKMKNFYLGDGNLQKVLEKTLEKNNLKEADEIMDILKSITIDLTPNRKYILTKYKNEIAD